MEDSSSLFGRLNFLCTGDRKSFRNCDNVFLLLRIASCDVQILALTSADDSLSNSIRFFIS